MIPNQTFTIPGLAGVRCIHVDHLPPILPGAASPLPFTHAQPGALLLAVPGIATFRIANGNTVEMAPEPDADPEAIAACLRGSVRATLLHQRGDIPLHAATLLPPNHDRAVALCGASVAGKSTLAWQLTRRGWRLLADDLTHLQWQEGRAIVHPNDTHLHLWQDACERHEISTAGLTRVRSGAHCFAVRVLAHTSSVPLGLMLNLRPGEEGLRPLTEASDRVVHLGEHVVRRRQLPALGTQAQHAFTLMHIGAACPAGILGGTRHQPTETLADLVEEALRWTHR